MARHLEKVKPSGRGLGFALPQAQGYYYPLSANYYPHFDDFLDTSLDTAEWADGSSLGTAGAAITYASSLIVMDTSTGTVGTATLRIRSALTAGMNIYNIPFRVTFAARISTTAGAGIAPTGGLDFYLGVRDTAETHIAQFHLDGSTAGSSSIAQPVVNVEVRAGSTAAAFIHSSAWAPFATLTARTATAFFGLVIDMTHRGVWFGFKGVVGSAEPAQQLKYVNAPVPRIDKNYFIDMQTVANGTAGFTQSDGVQLEVDSVTVEQYAPNDPRAYSDVREGSVRTAWRSNPSPSESGSLITAGAGLFLGVALTSTATGGANAFFAVYDTISGGSGVYDYDTNGSLTGKSRLLWIQQAQAQNSAAAAIGGFFNQVPAGGIPFYRGLVVGETTFDGAAVGGCTLNALVIYRLQT